MSLLPPRPSQEHLRKEAKYFAREHAVGLASAQRRVAATYGFRTWADLMRHVSVSREAGPGAIPPLYAAVRARDLDAVRALIERGENPRVGNGRETPLHAAARTGPFALVETLIVGGALEWQTDRAGRTPLDVAKLGRSPGRAAIVALLDRKTIADTSFRRAVDAIHAGDISTLERLLDSEPRLLRERIVGAQAYRDATRHQYFRDPKLFWFVAYNPHIAEHMPPNIVDVAQTMIARGVDQADLDYTLVLVMTGSMAREEGQQSALMRALLAANARVTRECVVTTAAHFELDALRTLLELGHEIDVPIAAALGDVPALRHLLVGADRASVTLAFALAIINRRAEAARLALDLGADIDASLPVHAHMTPLHQAAVHDDVELIDLLVERGAKQNVRDTLWDATPLDMARYLEKSEAVAALEGHAGYCYARGRIAHERRATRTRASVPRRPA